MSFYYLSFGTHGARSFIAEIAIPYEHAIMFLSCSGLCLLIVCCLLVLAHSSVATHCSTSGEVRLASNVSEYEGRVEVCYNGMWGSVCDHQWGTPDAKVVCRQLGLPTAYPDALFTYGGGLGPFHFTGFHCSGTESCLLDCPRLLDFSISQCHHSQDAGVRCLSGPCTEDEVRLNGDVVQVCHDSQWGLVCSSTTSWSISGADVVCRQVGIPSRDGRALQREKKFYQGVVILNDIICTGSEHSLTACTKNGYGHFSLCSDIAVAYCEAIQPCTQLNAIRLTYGNSTFGRLEVCLGGQWGTVCSIGTTNATAAVICRQLNNTAHGTVQPERYYYDKNFPYVVPIALTDMTCSGDETAISECSYKVVSGNNACNHMDDIMVHCFEESTSQSSDTEIDGGAIAGAVIGAVLLCAVVVIAVVILVIVFHRKKRQQEGTEVDILARTGGIMPSTSSVNEPHGHFVGGINAQSNPYGVSGPANINESSFLRVNEEAHRAQLNSRYMRELTHGNFIITSEQIKLLDHIGQGEFGVVYRAQLGPQGIHGPEVAVKTLKGNFNQQEVDQIVEESLKMSQFKHDHVMGLIGVCIDAGPTPYIVMPYMANGSLLRYLKGERGSLVLSGNADKKEVQDICKRLMVMCSQIASGMEYLAAEKYIHRDLAARNCMIDSNFLIKITDFGLSEDVFVRNYFRQGSADEMVKLPVKWMAPESLSDGHFSEKSDVWSYGVTMWEIFSGGKVPYPGTDPLTLMQRLEEGDRMSKPSNAACTDEIYTMMRKCWEMVPDNRPSFKELHSNTSKYTERISGSLEMGFNPFAGVKSTVAGKVTRGGRI